MKLEREPVFGQLSYKPELKSFDHNEINQNSRGLDSANWIGKESQNRVLFDPKDNGEEAGQIDALDLTATNFGCSKSVDDLKTCDEGEIKGVVPEKLESLEKQSDYYMDKSVTEYGLPELIVCDNETSCNTIKDICIDEGVPSKEKIWFETNMDEKAFCDYLSPDEVQKKELRQQQMDIVTTIPEDFKSSAQKYDVEENFAIPSDAKELVQRGETMYDASEKTAIDVPRDIFSPEKELSTDDLCPQNLNSKFSSKACSEAEQNTIQILNDKDNEIAETHCSPLVPATGESLLKLDPVPSAIELNCHVDELSNSSKVENGGVAVGVDCSVLVSISRFPNLDPFSSTERSNYLTDEMSNNVTADKGGTEDVRPENRFSKHLATQNLAEVDSDDVYESKIILSEVQPCLAPETIAREDFSENGAGQRPETSNTSMVDEDISDSEIVSSQVQHSSVPSTIAKDECPNDGDYNAQNIPIQVQPEPGESSFTAGVSFATLLNYKESISYSGTHNASSEVQHDQGESSFSAAERFLVQRDLGDSSFAAVSHVSSLINSSGPIPYSGSISLRSDSSATSTRSFAFPVMHPHEPFSSPVRMAKADRRLLGKHRGWKRGIFCCSF